MGQANSRQEAFWDACGFGRTHLVKKFIEEGIDINWVSFTHDCCPIHVASQGKPDVVKLLIDAKCNVNVMDSRGMTALHHAAMKGEADILQMLIEAGCELNTQDKNGWTALHNAAYWAHLSIVDKLLKNGASVELTNKHQRLALHEVARSQSDDDSVLGQIARHLMTAGADIDAISSDFGEADFTSLMFAAYHGHIEVVNALIEADCDVNINGSINKWTALHWAVERGQNDIVYMLVEAGADPCKKNMRGETAADRAKDQRIKEYLLNIINQNQDNTSADTLSISSSQSFIAQTAHDTAVAIERITQQSRSSASASNFVPITMPPLSIATSEERKRNIKLGIRRQTSAPGVAAGPTSPGWSPGAGPHVELATDSLGENASKDPSIMLLRSFQERLNRRIDKATKTLAGGLFRPEGTDPVYSSSSESSTREQTPSTREQTPGSGEVTLSSREATPSSREAPSSETTSSYESADGGEREKGDEEGGEKGEMVSCVREGSDKGEGAGGDSNDSIRDTDSPADNCSPHQHHPQPSDDPSPVVESLSLNVASLTVSNNSKEASPCSTEKYENSTDKRCSQLIEDNKAVNGCSVGAAVNSDV